MQFFRNLTRKSRKRSLRFFTRVSLILGVCLFFLGPQQIASAQVTVQGLSLTTPSNPNPYTSLQTRTPIVPAGESVYKFSLSSSDITITKNNSRVIFSPPRGSGGNDEILADKDNGWSESNGTYSFAFTIASGKTGTVGIEINLEYAGGRKTAQAVLGTLVDGVAPSIKFVEPPTTVEAKTPFDITIGFSESISGFAANDFSFAPDVADVSLSGPNGNSYTATITPDTDALGEVEVSVQVGAVTDIVGNSNSALSHTFTIEDTTPPRIEIDVLNALNELDDGPHNQMFKIRLNFTEETSKINRPGIGLVGLRPEDVTIAPQQNPALASIAATGQWETDPITIPVTPAANTDTTVTITIAAGIYKDAANNQNPSASTTVQIDTVPPEISFQPPSPPPSRDGYDLGINFSENVTGFDVTDLTITGGHATLGTAWETTARGPQSYDIAITPDSDADGEVTVTVPAGVATDTAGNANAAAEWKATFDRVPPTLTLKPPTTPQNAAFDITITADETIKDTTFTASDITITPTGAATATLTGSSPTWTAKVTPAAGVRDETVTIKVPASAVTDTVGNPNTAASQTVTIDTRPPTLTITPPTTPQNSAFDVTIKASETITGFTASDITISPTGAATATLTGSGTAWTARLTPAANQQATVTISISASAVTDTAGNANTAASTQTVRIDTLAPTLTITPPTTPQNSAFDVTIKASETITGFTASDITISPTGAATATLTGSGTAWTARVTHTGVRDEAVTFSISASAVTDTAGNANTASASGTVTIDTQPPTLTSVEVPTDVQPGAFDVTFTFSEAVSGFEITDIDYSQSTAVVAVDDTAVVAVDDTDVAADADLTEIVASRYTFRITPHVDTEGDVTIRLPAGAVADAATNLLVAPTADLTVTVAVEPSWMPDPSLRQLVRATLGLSENEAFSQADMLNIVTLAGPYLRIMYLKGLEHASNLTELTLNSNLISDLSPLSELTELTTLNLEDNDITDITPLEELIALTRLELAANKIADLTPLGYLLQLTTLNLRENQIDDLTPLSALVALTDLDLTSNQIEDVSPLAALPNLKILRISDNPLTDTTQLTGLAETIEADVNIQGVIRDVALSKAIRTELDIAAEQRLTRAVLQKLTTLQAAHSAITDLTGLENAVNLTSLALEENAIVDLAPLEELLKLKSLNLSTNAIRDITPLAGLTALETLDLSGNTISDITSLKSLTSLKTLNLNKNQVADLTPLTSLTGIEILRLQSCGITDVDVISELTWLLALDISRNTIRDITGLKALTELSVLNLSSNEIRSIAAIREMAYLRGLDVSGNRISDMSPVAALTALTILNGNNNAISNMKSLSDLEELTILTLSGNSLSSLDALATLSKLKILDVRDNTITDVSSLGALKNLERLDLRINNIDKVAVLAGLPKLTLLRLAENPIMDTSPLFPLTRRRPPVDMDIAVDRYAPWDVNEDGQVNTTDTQRVTAALGQSEGDILDPRTDVNADRTVNAVDLKLVRDNYDSSGVQSAPAVNARRIRTQVLANYPNPFNPETWIPYQLREDSNVQIFIYDAHGALVQRLDIGHQKAGTYTQRARAAHWNGKNTSGERVASGVYFYVFTAGDFEATRKMLILK